MNRGIIDPFKHMVQIVSLLGPTPKEFLKRSETIGQCFYADGWHLPCSLMTEATTNHGITGNWKAVEHEKIRNTSLEDLETRLEGEDRVLFLKFIRSMFKWLPEDRKTARELLDDPWRTALRRWPVVSLEDHRRRTAEALTPFSVQLHSLLEVDLSHGQCHIGSALEQNVFTCHLDRFLRELRVDNSHILTGRVPP